MASLDLSTKRISCGVFVAALALLVSGCQTFFGEDGYFRDRGDDYLKAETIEPIKLPSTSNGERIGQLFVIPRINDAGVHLPAEFEVPKPSRSDKVTEQPDQVKIQKLGDRRWIDISNPPGEVWPGARDFLSSKGMPLADQDPVAGTLETAWLSLKAVETDGSKVSTTGRDRYRITLEPGLSPGSTEIHVLQMTVPESAAHAGVAWPAQSTDAERETWLVKELATYLARNTGAQASMVAQAIGSSEQRVELVQYPEPGILMRVDYARAWASVGGSLNRDGFRIENSNREQGQVQVVYSTKVAAKDDDEGSDKSGVFARFAKIFDFSSSKQKNDAGEQSYRVLLQQQPDDRVRVTIRNGSGEVLPTNEADRLLRRIRDNLL